MFFCGGILSMSKDQRSSFALGSVLLFLGDMFVFLLFVYMGRVEHEMERSIYSIFITALPFMLAWVVLGGLIGSFQYTAIKSVKDTLKKTTLAWLMAGLSGLVIRGVLLQSIPALPFVLVTLGLILVLLLVWRISFSIFFVKIKLNK
jgi:hypothetical protein